MLFCTLQPESPPVTRLDWSDCASTFPGRPWHMGVYRNFPMMNADSKWTEALAVLDTAASKIAVLRESKEYAWDDRICELNNLTEQRSDFTTGLPTVGELVNSAKRLHLLLDKHSFTQHSNVSSPPCADHETDQIIIETIKKRLFQLSIVRIVFGIIFALLSGIAYFAYMKIRYIYNAPQSFL